MSDWPALAKWTPDYLKQEFERMREARTIPAPWNLKLVDGPLIGPRLPLVSDLFNGDAEFIPAVEAEGSAITFLARASIAVDQRSIWLGIAPGLSGYMRIS